MLTPSHSEAPAFLAALDPKAEYFAFRTFPDGASSDGALTASFHGGAPDAFARLDSLNGRGAGVFVTINETDGRGAKNENIQSVRAVFCDYDDAATAATSVAKASAALAPSAVVESSPGKFHVYWLVDGLPLDRFTSWQSHLAGKFGSDPKIKDLARVMRLPGFVHQKGAPFLSRIVSIDAAKRYSESDLIAAFGEPRHEAKTTKATAAPRQTARTDDGYVVGEGGRNGVLVKEAGRLRNMGWSTEAIRGALHALNSEQFDPPLSDEEVDTVVDWIGGKEVGDVVQCGADEWGTRIGDADGDVATLIDVARGIVADPSLARSEAAALMKRAARAAGVSLATLKADALPAYQSNGLTVDVVRANFAESVDAAVAALRYVPGLRQRGGQLVEVVERPDGAAIVEVPIPRLAYLLSSVAKWRYGDTLGSPDGAVLQAVMVAGAWPGVPHISGVVEQPVLLPDGRIVAQDGHDAGTGLEAVFDPSRFPEYQGSPAEALAELESLLTEFPFVCVLDKSVVLAAIMTAAIRSSLTAAPAFLLVGPDLGSGKTYAAQVVGEFAGGTGPARRWPGRVEEQEKTITAILNDGKRVVLFDNMSRDWASDDLAKALTSPECADRMLGGSSAPATSTRVLWLGTGNNIKPVRDLVRRVLTCHLDPRCPRPWEREFNGDPLATVQADRGRWIMLVLAVLSDYLKSGTVPAMKPFGSFGEWSRIVRGCLIHHGYADPVGAIATAVEDDTEREQLDRLLWAWGIVYGDEPTTCAEIVKNLHFQRAHGGDAGAVMHEVVHEIAGDRRGDVDVRQIGNWLRDNAGRVVDGVRLERVAGKRTRAGVQWKLVRITP